MCIYIYIYIYTYISLSIYIYIHTRSLSPTPTPPSAGSAVANNSSCVETHIYSKLRNINTYYPTTTSFSYFHWRKQLLIRKQSIIHMK